MRHGLQAITAALIAACLVMGADWMASTLSPAASRDAWAPTIGHMRRDATTTTTSTSTSTSASTSSSSTSSTTTTSTSTSTTTTTVPGDVSQDPNWVGIWYMEDSDPQAGGGGCNLTDSSASGNCLSGATCTGAVRNTSQFVQGAASLYNPNTDTTTCRWGCEAGNGCADAEFLFDGASDDFTLFAMYRPTNVHTNRKGIMGTDDGFSAIGDGGWAFYVDANEMVCFSSDNDTTETSICDTTAYTLNTWYSYALTFDGADDDAWLEVDGTEVASSTSMPQPATGDSDFQLGRVGTFTSGMGEGQFDQVAVYAGRITQAWRTRIQVCLIDGSACSCNESNPTQYVSRPRHTSQGGPIAGPMPDCNDLTIDTE